MAAPLEYWATMAQVMPIVALAVVVEARALSSRWEPAWPAWLLISQSLIWASTLLTLGIGEFLAFSALRGSDVADWLPAALDAVVWYALSILIVGPALEFLAKGNAGPLAYLFTRHRILRFKWLVRRATREVKAVERESIEMLSQLESDLVESLTDNERAREGLDRADAGLSAAVERQRAFMAQNPGVEALEGFSDAEIAVMFEQTEAARVRSAEHRAVLVKDLELARAQIEETRRKSANALKQIPELEDQFRDALRERKEAMRQVFAAFPDNPSPERGEAAPIVQTPESELAPLREGDPADQP